MKILIRVLVTTLVTAVIFSAGAGVGYALRDYIVNDQPAEEAAEDLGLYWEVWNRVHEQFYGGVPGDAPVTYGAIKGSLAVLDDPYTIFLEPEPAAKEKASSQAKALGPIGNTVWNSPNAAMS